MKVIEMDKMRLDSTNFKCHMEDKISLWEPFSLHLGHDFAVFEFHFRDEMDKALESLQHYAEFYCYGVCTDGTDRLCIINKANQ